MKLLVRDYTNNLCWEEAIYKNGHFHKADGSRTHAEATIYVVKDDDRNKTVICSACGKEILNTKASIKAHRNMVNKSDKCFACRHLRHRNEKVISQKYVLNEDGTYSESTKRTVNLVCYRSYRHYDINSSDAHDVCMYKECENATFNHIEDFWTRHPGAFDEFVTVDRIIDVGFKHMSKRSNEIKFTLRFGPTLIAVVNNQGICYKLELEHRSHTYELRYSKKYDKLFVLRNGYEDFNSLDIAQSTKESIMKKIKTLYQ